MDNIKKGSNLLILGAGQYGKIVWETAKAMECFDRIDFLDDNNPIAIGKLADYKTFGAQYTHVFVAIGNAKLRKQWLSILEDASFALPRLIHPQAYISASAVLGRAIIAEPMAVVNAGATVETGTLLCAGCVVNHNAHVMSVCQIDCNAVVAANATVPEGTKVTSCTVYDRE